MIVDGFFDLRARQAVRRVFVGRNDADGEGTDGLLLYLKSGLHGTEPMDVLSYAMAHPAFPHETTANQFFTESQFESMISRRLAGSWTKL